MKSIVFYSFSIAFNCFYVACCSCCLWPRSPPSWFVIFAPCLLLLLLHDVAVGEDELGLVLVYEFLHLLQHPVAFPVFGIEVIAVVCLLVVVIVVVPTLVVLIPEIVAVARVEELLVVLI